MASTRPLTASLDRCQRRLATVWFVWSSLVTGLVFLQTVFGHFEGRGVETWKWIAASLGPPLALLVGAVTAKALTSKHGQSKTLVSYFAYRLSLWISLLYLTLVTLTILLEPVAMMAAQKADLNLIGQSELWLVPLQSLLTASFGAFGASKVDA